MTTPEKREAARSLRRRQTTAEATAWELLRDRKMLGLKFRRQQVVEGFIVDFFCAERRLIVEIDGGLHDEPEQMAADERRSGVFNETGLVVVRLRNDDVHAEVICARLSAVL